MLRTQFWLRRVHRTWVADCVHLALACPLLKLKHLSHHCTKDYNLVKKKKCQMFVPKRYTARRFCCDCSRRKDERLLATLPHLLTIHVPCTHRKIPGVGMFVTSVLETHLHFSHSMNEYCITIFMHLSLSALNVLSYLNVDLRSTTQ